MYIFPGWMNILMYWWHQIFTNFYTNKYICLDLFKYLNVFEYLLCKNSKYSRNEGLKIFVAQKPNEYFYRWIYLSRNIQAIEYLWMFVTHWSQLALLWPVAEKLQILSFYKSTFPFFPVPSHPHNDFIKRGHSAGHCLNCTVLYTLHCTLLFSTCLYCLALNSTTLHSSLQSTT